jgi:hypothetical protein
MPNNITVPPENMKNVALVLGKDLRASFADSGEFDMPIF